MSFPSIKVFPLQSDQCCMCSFPPLLSSSVRPLPLVPETQSSRFSRYHTRLSRYKKRERNAIPGRRSKDDLLPLKMYIIFRAGLCVCVSQRQKNSVSPAAVIKARRVRNGLDLWQLFLHLVSRPNQTAVIVQQLNPEQKCVFFLSRKNERCPR